MNDKMIAAELVARIGADAQAVRVAALTWAGRMRAAGEAMDAPEVLELADVVEVALVDHGAEGLVDLLLAGRSLGGLSEEDVRTVLEIVDARAARRLALAA